MVSTTNSTQSHWKKNKNKEKCFFNFVFCILLCLRENISFFSFSAKSNNNKTRIESTRCMPLNNKKINRNQNKC